MKQTGNIPCAGAASVRRKHSVPVCGDKSNPASKAKPAALVQPVHLQKCLRAY